MGRRSDHAARCSAGLADRKQRRKGRPAAVIRMDPEQDRGLRQVLSFYCPPHPAEALLLMARPRKPFSKEEISRSRRLFAAGASVAAIARRLRRDKSSVRRWVKPEAREKNRAYMERYRCENLERLQEEDRRRKAGTPARGRTEVRTGHEAKRSKKRKALTPASPKEFRRRRHLFGNRCAFCRQRSSESGGLLADLLLPQESGGLEESINTIPVCPSCAEERSGMDARQWFLSQTFFSESAWLSIARHCPGQLD